MLQVILVEFLSRRSKDESKQCMLPIFKETYIASLHPPLPTSTMLILLICSYPQYSQPYYNMYMFRQAFCKCNICKCNRPVTITRTLTINKILQVFYRGVYYLQSLEVYLKRESAATLKLTYVTFYFLVKNHISLTNTNIINSLVLLCKDFCVEPKDCIS